MTGEDRAGAALGPPFPADHAAIARGPQGAPLQILGPKRLPYRQFGFGAAVAFSSGFGMLLFMHTFAMPTSGIRAQMYIMFWETPALVAIAAALPTLALSLPLFRAAGLSSLAALAGAVVGAGLVGALLVSKAMGYLVWIYPPEVTSVGEVIRSVVALAVPLGVVALARRGNTD